MQVNSKYYSINFFLYLDLPSDWDYHNLRGILHNEFLISFNPYDHRYRNK